MSNTAWFRRFAALVLFTICLLSWVALGASLALDWPNQIQIAAAISTEVTIWGGAALLGWTAIANRSLILRHFGVRQR